MKRQTGGGVNEGLRTIIPPPQIKLNKKFFLWVCRAHASHDLIWVGQMQFFSSFYEWAICGNNKFVTAVENLENNNLFAKTSKLWYTKSSKYVDVVWTQI